VADDNDSGRLLLGCRGWPQPSWRGGYFPEDLPGDWEFAYYSNDAGCLLLPAADWLALQAEQLTDWLDECEPWFRFYLEAPQGELPLVRLEWFGEHLGGVLVGEPRCDLPEWLPVWQRAGDRGRWVEHRTQAVLNYWDMAGQDLRVLRARLQALSPGTRVLVVGGEGVTAEVLQELRTLAELLGVA